MILNACHFTGWAAGKKGAPCVWADGGRLVVIGYLLFVVPRVILHLCCIVGAALTDPAG